MKNAIDREINLVCMHTHTSDISVARLSCYVRRQMKIVEPICIENSIARADVLYTSLT